MSDIYYGHGTKEQFDDYMDFINYVFGFNGNQNDFKKLLPKLYKEEYMPAYHAVNAIRDGKFLAAIGTYDAGATVCGVELKCRGVGNVAVHPYHRGEGYMKKCLHMAIDEMIADGMDYSALGGQRQRYNYFSYDKVGTVYAVHVNSTNLRHAFGTAKTEVRMLQVQAQDQHYLALIKQMYSLSNFVPTRKDEMLYDILCSWEARPYVFIKDDEVVGYCVLKETHMSEVYAKEPALLADFVRAAMEQRSKLTVSLSPLQEDYISVLAPLCDDIQIVCNHMFTVFNFRKVIYAFMLLKQTYATLPDGEMRVLVHGRAGDERLRIAVREGVVTVENTDEEVDTELTHLEAMRYFFANVSEKRAGDALAKAWFPLPIYELRADAV